MFKILRTPEDNNNMGKWEIQEEEEVKMKMHLFRKVKIEKDKNGFAEEKKEENSWFGKEFYK
jgi:hypothetical protein